MKMWITEWYSNSNVKITVAFFIHSPRFLASRMVVNKTEHTSCPLEFEGLGLASKSSQTCQSSGTMVPSAMVLCQCNRGPSAYKEVNKGRGTNMKLEHRNPLQCLYLPRSVSSVHVLRGTHEKPWNSPLLYFCHIIPLGPYPSLFPQHKLFYTLFWKKGNFL